MRALLLCLLLWLGLGVASATAQTAGDPCAPIADATKTPGAVPDNLLADTGAAVPCLMGTLGALAQVGATAQLDAEERDELSRTTAALSKLISTEGVPLITRMRELDSAEIVSLLSFGARSADRSTRLNSTMVLSNIVDNSTVCIVMDHLADPDLAKTDEGKNGRANLLAVASVVAPWAMKSNYRNMENLLAYVEQDIADEGDVAQTSKILANFKERLKFQDKVELPNRNVDSPEARRCNEWPALYGSNSAFAIKYPFTPPQP